MSSSSLLFSSSSPGGVVVVEGARIAEKLVSFSMISSRDWMVESPRWMVGSSSESESADDVAGLGFPEFDFASEMMASRADLWRRGLESFRGCWSRDLEPGEVGFSLRIKSVVANFRISSSRFIVSSFASSRSDGVGIGGPLPPVGSGVSTQAPVTSGVLRIIEGIDSPGVSSPLSTHAPVTTGVLRSTADLVITGVI